MQKTRRSTILLFILAMLLLLILPIAFLYFSDPPVYLETAGKYDNADVVFILRGEGNHLELIDADGTIHLISSVDPRTLPKQDQEALAKGIPLANNVDLEELLQDFSS